jgi:hypothetical protein
MEASLPWLIRQTSPPGHPAPLDDPEESTEEEEEPPMDDDDELTSCSPGKFLRCRVYAPAVP